jgi:hypothetical protein
MARTKPRRRQGDATGRVVKREHSPRISRELEQQRKLVTTLDDHRRQLKLALDGLSEHQRSQFLLDMVPTLLDIVVDHLAVSGLINRTAYELDRTKRLYELAQHHHNSTPETI